MKRLLGAVAAAAMNRCCHFHFFSSSSPPLLFLFSFPFSSSSPSLLSLSSSLSLFPYLRSRRPPLHFCRHKPVNHKMTETLFRVFCLCLTPNSHGPVTLPLFHIIRVPFHLCGPHF
eukprot:TRINITY_DN9869_c0_g1_i3.p2 TRINITY_DN9869_c0_g1~~TRINITY_DN9869_c0_g1_i3.p2  ORF type:complete len:116 (+),score=16.55 TRINITY_DN9869_c0_g1_i3:104-451(+)